jgi:hypothetical protein
MLVHLFDRNNKFYHNQHVRHRKVDKHFVQQNLHGNGIAITPSSSSFSSTLTSLVSSSAASSRDRECSGWLADIIHHFAAKVMS